MVTTEIRVLNCLKLGCTTRKEIAEKTGMKKGFAKVFGAVSKGKAGCPKGTLVGDGLVAAVKADEGGEWEYKLTAAGKAALAKEGKEAIAGSMQVREVNRTAKPAAKGGKGANKAKANKASGKAAKAGGKAKASKAPKAVA